MLRRAFREEGPTTRLEARALLLYEISVGRRRRYDSKILNHSSGMGSVCDDDVRRRAMELATIDGRRAEEFTQSHWEQAFRELHGGHPGMLSGDENGMSDAVSEQDMVDGTVVHQVENLKSDDDINIVEELIAEGMDEAVHEQMLEATRERSDEEESEGDR